MAYHYIRRNYGVNPRVGQRIEVNGQPGAILHTDTDPMYLVVRFDGDTTDSHVHPTWNVDYNPQPNFALPVQAAVDHAHG